MTSPPSESNTSDANLEAESEESKAAERESLKIRELQQILSDPANFTQIVVEEETKAGMNEELKEMVKESEIILERIDQQLLELGPFAKDTFPSPPVAPKDDPGGYPITFMPPNYQQFSLPGMDMVPMATASGAHGRNRRRVGRVPPPPATSQGIALPNGKPKRNSRGSETGSVSSPMAYTPIDMRVDFGVEGVKERDSASPTAAKEPPKSKWRKVGSAGTAVSTTRPPLTSRSSSDRLQNNLQSPILDRLSVLSPPTTSSPTPVVPSPSHSTPVSSKSHQDSSVNSPIIIPPASEFEMGSLFSMNQWELVESPHQGEHVLPSNRTHSNHPHGRHGQQAPPHHHGRGSVERGDSSLSQSISCLSAEIDRHHEQVAASRVSSNREPHRRTPTPHGSDPIPRPLSRPHSHSSSPPHSHPLHTHPHHLPPHSHHQPTPQHSDIHALLASTTGCEISRHLVVSGGVTVGASRPNFSIAHLTSARETINSSPLVTSATSVYEERIPHANSASPLSEQPRGWVQRSSASPSLGGNGMLESENPLIDRRRRNSSTSTSSHRSGRLHSFDDGVTHHQQQQQRSSPRATKPPPPGAVTISQHQQQLPPPPLLQQHGHAASQQQHGIDQKQQLTPGGAAETKLGATVNPYAAALWGAVSAGQFAPGQVVDPASTTTVPRFPFPPAAAAPFLPGANWIQTPGGMIATAAPGLSQVRPAMLPFDPSSPYKGPFLGSPFLTQYRYSLPPGPGMKGFPGLTGVSAGGSPSGSSHPGTPTATMAMAFSQPALYPALQSGSSLSAFKSLNDPSVSNRSSPPIIHHQHFLGGAKDEPTAAGSELAPPGLNMIQPPHTASAAAALMAAGTNLNLMPYLGMNQMPFGIGGIQPTSIGQQTPGAGVSLFNPRLSTLATTGIHTGSEGNLTALGTSKEAAAIHRSQQRRGSAASIDMSSLPGHSESPPNQIKKGYPHRNETTHTSGGGGNNGGKWKPVADHSPPVSQMLFNMSPSPSSTPFPPSMLPNSSHMMTSALGQMLPLSFGTPPTHQQMRGGKGAEGAGRGSPRGTPDKMKLRIHQVKNDDFKMQGKPDRRRRRWKNKGQEVITVLGTANDTDKVAVAPPINDKQTASQLRRVRSDTARKTSSTPPSVLSADEKDEVVDVGDSSDNNYALNMLATMSTMQQQQSREQKTSDNPLKTSIASPLTISTSSLPSSEPSKNALLHSPVSLAGAKSLLMLGKDMSVKESGKSAGSTDDRTAEEVTNVESTAVDSLLQLSGAVLPSTSGPLRSNSHPEEARDHIDSKDEDFAAQRRETRSASYSAAEAMLMMGSSSKESEQTAENNSAMVAASKRQPLPLEVFGNGSRKEKQPPSDTSGASEKAELTSRDKASTLSKKPKSLSIDSEATDTDSEATLTPQSPAKRLPSYSSTEGRMECEATSDTTISTPPRLPPNEAVSHPSSMATIPSNVAIETPSTDTQPDNGGDLAMNPTIKNMSPNRKNVETDQQLSSLRFSSSSVSQSVPAIEDGTSPSSLPPIESAPSMSKFSCDTSLDDDDINNSMPPNKRLKLCRDEDRNESVKMVEAKNKNWQEVDSDMHACSSVLDVGNDKKDSPKSDLKLTQVDETPPVMPEPQKLTNVSTTCDSVKEQPKESAGHDEDNTQSAVVESDVRNESPKQQSGDVDKRNNEDLSESEKHLPLSTDKVTTWSAYADVVEASYDEKDQDNFAEKVGDDSTKMETEETGAPSPPTSSPLPPSPPPAKSEEASNKNVEKLKLDVCVRQSSVSSISSPPFTPDPPIEIGVFENLPPSPKMTKKQKPDKSETITKEAKSVKHNSSNAIDKDQVHQSSGASTTLDSTSVNSIGVTGAPQNRLTVSRPRLQHRKHVIGHSSKLGKDGKGDSRKRLRPPNDSQAKLFEVDPVPVTTATTTATPHAPPPSHASHHPSHLSSIKEKKPNDRAPPREDPHQDERPHHTSSVRKLKRPGHSTSKSGLSSGHKPNKHNSNSKCIRPYCLHFDCLM